MASSIVETARTKEVLEAKVMKMVRNMMKVIVRSKIAIV